MKLDALNDFYLEELKDVYSAENQILEALPKMEKKASSQDLKQGFKAHEEQTRQQVERLDQIFKGLGMKPGNKTCKAMKGIIAEGEELMKEDMDPDVMDAALIAAAQKVEHYEIATYGTLAAFARRLGHQDALALLEQTLSEEKQTDEKLTKLAEGHINKEAQKS